MEERKNCFQEYRQDGLIYYKIPLFEETGLVKTGFSTRIGGVSKEHLTSLNLGLKKNDARENLLENYHRICKALSINERDLVMTRQTHDDHIRLVTEEDKGKGLMKERDYDSVDALMTGERGLPMIIFSADCVPLYFLDTKQKAIALAHAGWRGTVKKIGQKTLFKMREAFGTNPKDVLLAIGPSIGKCCFEVDKDVVEEFERVFPFAAEVIEQVSEKKYHIDLWKTNELMMLEMGILEGNIAIASICTMCHKDLFYSHRGDHGKTGSLGAFLELV